MLFLLTVDAAAMMVAWGSISSLDVTHRCLRETVPTAYEFEQAGLSSIAAEPLAPNFTFVPATG